MGSEFIQIRKDLAKDHDSLKSIDSRLRSLNQEWLRKAYSPNTEKDQYFSKELYQLQESIDLLKHKQGERVDKLLNHLNQIE